MMSFLSSSITAELRDAYLDRLDLEAELPSAEGLRHGQPAETDPNVVRAASTHSGTGTLIGAGFAPVEAPRDR